MAPPLRRLIVAVLAIFVFFIVFHFATIEQRIQSSEKAESQLDSSTPQNQTQGDPKALDAITHQLYFEIGYTPKGQSKPKKAKIVFGLFGNAVPKTAVRLLKLHIIVTFQIKQRLGYGSFEIMVDHRMDVVWIVFFFELMCGFHVGEL
jgi:hypothetical protein